MPRKLPILRVAGPTIFVSLLLFGACTLAAVFLYRIQTSTAVALTEDIDSQKVAEQMEQRLTKLKAQVRSRSDQVESLHDGFHDLITQARNLANSPQEDELVLQIDQTYQNYLELWQQREDEIGQAYELSTKQLLKRLDELFTLTARLFNYNKQQTDASEAALKNTAQWLAWGLVGIGVVGSLAGITLGYGVARALRHSIYKLSVRIRDAADMLRQDLPTVTFTDGEGIEILHDQMQYLVREIDQTVERLHQREREVRRAEQLAAVGQLAAGVAHELRNPLTAVKMLVQNAREDLESRGVPSEDLQIIELEIRRLERSLQTFLDFARPPKMERRQVKMASILEEALALVRGRAKKQNVAIELIPADPPVQLEADPEQLRQLFVNLTMNALDMMPRGGTLRLRVVRLGDGMAEVQISDTGSGIAAEILPRLFEPFVSKKETGLGLGLVVSKRIAQDHGGTLRGENLPGGGACFTLRLPALGKN